MLIKVPFQEFPNSQDILYCIFHIFLMADKIEILHPEIRDNLKDYSCKEQIRISLLPSMVSY